MSEVKMEGVMDGINLSKQALLHAQLAMNGILFPVLDNIAKSNDMAWDDAAIALAKDVIRKAVEAALAKQG